MARWNPPQSTLGLLSKIPLIFETPPQHPWVKQTFFLCLKCRRMLRSSKVWSMVQRLQQSRLRISDYMSKA